MKIKSILLLLIVSISFFQYTFAGKGEDKSIDDIPELKGEITFKEEGGSISYINITQGSDGVYRESFVNEYINNNIEVSLLCTSGGDVCDGTSTGIIVEQNSTGSLTIIDKYGRELTKDFEVRKIDKNPPVGELSYNPSLDERTNGERVVTLFGEDEESWLVGETTPSFTCDVEGGCTGFLSLEDSAGNILEKEYNISKIDKIPPTIHVNQTTEIIDGKQKIGISCEDAGGSGCKVEGEEIYYLDLGININKCVYDNAGNSKCVNIKTSSSTKDFSDEDLNWTNDSRTIWLSCRDESGGSGCEQSKYTKIIYDNINDTSLKIYDNAGNSLEKHFQISKIDNEKPSVSIEGPTTFKASDSKRIKISSTDLLSGVNKIIYNWDNSCLSEGIPISNNSFINYTISGTHKLYVCSFDNAGNIQEEPFVEFTIYPGDLDEAKTEMFVDSNGDKYANNNDFYTYILLLKDKYGNLIYDKNVDVENNLSGDILYTDAVNLDGNPIIIFDSNFINTPDVKKNIFKLKSLSPGQYSQDFKIKITNWGDDYIDNGTTKTINKNISNFNSFKKPIAGDISIIEGGDIPEIGKDQKYKISLINEGNVSGYSMGNLNLSETTVINKVDGHIWNTFLDVDNSFGSNVNNYVGFNGNIDVNNETEVLSGVNISSDSLWISYLLEGQEVKYYLDDFSINGCNNETLGLKVFGTLQGDGKSSITGQEQNFSDLSKGEIRSKIRKNAYLLIKNRKTDTIVNGVRYVNGENVTIGGEIIGYETLIVKDGNVIINSDLNNSGNKLGIIVLKDNYSINSDYNNIGNIYVNKNVKNINAVIYADGTFRSANSNGYSYNDIELSNRLELIGTLFTRNTIGGAVQASTQYTLPGGQTTSNYDLAEIYDLNYIRKIDNTCFAGDDNYSFIIKYNPKIQIDPPIGFGN